MGKIANTFEELLLLQTGRYIGNIRPYRLKTAPNFFAGFECLTAHEAVREGFTLPERRCKDEQFYAMRIGPAVFRELIPSWMFSPVFEPVPEQGKEDVIQTIQREIQSHADRQADLAGRAYALSVVLIKECGGRIIRPGDGGDAPFVHVPFPDADPVELVIMEAFLNESEEIVLRGYGYYSGTKYEWTCHDSLLGTDILEFVLLCHEKREEAV